MSVYLDTAELTVTVPKLNVDRVFSCGEGFPDPHGFAFDYDYYPRHPTAKKLAN
jgi:hypothetical protein